MTHVIRRVLWNLCACFSRAANRAIGGQPGKTICHRVALRYGWDCLFCRVIAAVLNDRDHCLDELSAQEIYALAKRRKASR